MVNRMPVPSASTACDEKIVVIAAIKQRTQLLTPTAVAE